MLCALCAQYALCMAPGYFSAAALLRLCGRADETGSEGWDATRARAKISREKGYRRHGATGAPHPSIAARCLTAR